MRAKIASYVKAPMGAYPGHYSIRTLYVQQKHNTIKNCMELVTIAS